MKKKYDILPKNSMEFGGIMCGHIENKTAHIKKIIDIPSSMGSKNNYYFNRSIINSSLCSPYKVIGLWHTHPSFSPFPSNMDRNTSSRLNTIVCVLTKSLRCFKGEKDFSIKIDI